MSFMNDQSRYSALDENSESGFEDQQKSHHFRKPWWYIRKEYIAWGWAATTFTFSLVSLLLVLSGREQCSMNRSDTGSLTDLGIARAGVETEIRTFTGTLQIQEDGSIMRLIEGIQYVGPASQEMDDAWEDLLIAQELGLTDDEAGELKDYTLQNNLGYNIIRPAISENRALYLANVEFSLYVTHSLHCVNMLRRHIDFDYYYGNGSSLPSFYRVHLDHCLDHLRQAVECQSDITPVTWAWSDVLGLPTSSTNRPHTCRSYKHLREWSMSRRVNSHVSGVSKANGS